MENSALNADQLNGGKTGNGQVIPRVLIVDDEEPIRRSLARLLKRNGLDCTPPLMPMKHGRSC